MTSRPGNLSDRHAGCRAVITGGASGIGRSTALQFAREGASVITCDMSEAGLAGLCAEAEAEGLHLSTAIVDLTDPDAVEGFAAGVLDDGAVEILVNNAGIMDEFVPLHALEDERWERVMKVNLDAPMRLSRAVLAGMRDAGRGVIVNVTSRAGMFGGPSGCAYSVSKHGVVGLTRNIAARYGGEGIRCNAVAPGGVATGIASTGMPADPHEMDVWGPSIGVGGRVAEPHEIAEVISWLASDESHNVNGAIVPADHGWSVL